MSLVQAAVLGVVQGVTELFPVSSSAHLAAVPRLTGWPDQGLAYDVALHWGTLLAFGIFFWRDWLSLAMAGLKREDSRDRLLFDGIVLATLPGALAGFLIDDYVETVFRTPARIGAMLIVFGIILAAADRAGAKRRGVADMTLKDCVLIGLAQALAVVPGVSRSGITMTAALLLGITRVDAARFSFLMAVPIVFGAGVLKLKDLPPGGIDAAFWTGIALSCLTALAALKFLLGFLRTRSFYAFAVYRIAFGLFLIAFSARLYRP